MSTPACSHPTDGPFASPCEGALWKSPKYFALGVRKDRADYRCEKHARWAMGANPVGPRYQPAQARAVRL